MSDIGGWISERLGSKNKERAGGFSVDPNAYQYGGSPGGADEAANRYRNQAEGAQGRQGVRADFGNALGNRQNALEAREGQRTAAELMMARAQGRVPSIARMAADRQMGQAVSAQQAAAASARGPAGLALAQRNAAGNIAGAQSAIANQGQLNEMQERLAAEQAALGAYGGIRGQDYTGQGLDAQQAQAQAQLDAQQRALNDQFSLGMTGFEHGTRQSQLGAQMQGQAQASANTLGAQGINAGVGGQNAATNLALGMGAINVGAGVGGSFATGGRGVPKPAAHGGPIGRGELTLVGEEGPELIVPRESGYVIPAMQTRSILRMAPLRAHGGPVEAGQPFVGGEEGAELVVPNDMARATWGNATPDANAQRGAMWLATMNADADRQTRANAAATESPWARDVRQVQTLRQVAPDLVNEEDEQRERRGILVMKGAKRDATKPKGYALAAKDEAPKPLTAKDRAIGALSSLGSKAGEIAGQVDTRYHGPAGGYQPPPMVVLPAPRAHGGPMLPGNPYMVGEQGPEIVLPAGIGRMRNAGPSAAVADVSFAGSSGMLGGSPMGELKAHSDFATRFQRQGGASPMAYGAREEGGPVSKDRPYLVGEKGPELVRKRTPEEERAYAAGIADAPMHYGGALASDMNTVPILLATSAPGVVSGAAQDTVRAVGGLPMAVSERVSGWIDRASNRAASGLARMRGNR